MEMLESPDRPARRFSPVASLLILFGLMVVLSAVSQIALIYPLVKWLTGADLSAAGTSLFTNPTAYPHSWVAMMLMQGINSLFSFTLTALIYWYLIEKRNIVFIEKGSPDPLIWAAVLVLVISYIPFNSLIFEWNQKLPLPEWMVNSEKQLETLTKFLTQFPDFLHFIVGIFVIAVLPALGEELLFRATLQKLFQRWWGSPHLAVWLAAAIFSAYHMQFMGFFPRMILGAMFGYLYLWSRNLWIPVFAHFVNNGFVVLMIYLRGQKLVDIDVENNESIPLTSALVSGVIALSLMRIIYTRLKPQIPEA
ncbi:membrane protease YdiL (CAAX protease family) [Siphonobacter sp. SORGH_AS 1065]|nr:membrane protease YdiL (CAAX protease family) [Siphonobacter sp. SORGH_AS_1065]